MSTVIQTLITSGVLVQDTVVTAKISNQSKYGMITFQYRDMVIDKINDTCDMLLLRDPYSSIAITLSINDITGIECMTLDRYAEVYNINADGSNKNTGRKRGRKPKSAGL